MKKKFVITEEEFEAIKEAISGVLNLFAYNYVSAEDANEAKISMSKETFFKDLRRKFIIE